MNMKIYEVWHSTTNTTSRGTIHPSETITSRGPFLQGHYRMSKDQLQNGCDAGPKLNPYLKGYQTWSPNRYPSCQQNMSIQFPLDQYQDIIRSKIH